MIINHINKIKNILRSYRRPSNYYFNNSTNEEYWKGAKKGWRDCIDYIYETGDLDDDFEKAIITIIKESKKKRENYAHLMSKDWNKKNSPTKTSTEKKE